MNMQQRAFAAIFEPEPNSEYAKQQVRSRMTAKARSTTTAKARGPDYGNARRSPLPSVCEIDAALERKYGATRHLETRS